MTRAWRVRLCALRAGLRFFRRVRFLSFSPFLHPDCCVLLAVSVHRRSPVFLTVLGKEKAPTGSPVGALRVDLGYFLRKT